jgi:prevent-host-death family protein
MNTVKTIKTISAMKARQNFGEILEEVYYKGDQFVIERAGKSMAAVVPLGRYKADKALRDKLFKKINTVRNCNSKISSKIISSEVSEALRVASR